MHRSPLLRYLTDYQQQWPEETILVQRFINFVEAHENCFERSLLQGHVTASAWVVNQAGTHVLLTHHRKLNKWLQLGGHADGNPDVVASALREVQEESGLDKFEIDDARLFDIDIHEIPARKAEPAHFHYDARFVVTATGSEVYTVSEESHDLGWIKINNLWELTEEESMLRMARKWLAA